MVGRGEKIHPWQCTVQLWAGDGGNLKNIFPQLLGKTFVQEVKGGYADFHGV